MKKLYIWGDSILRGVTYSEERGAHGLCRGFRLDRVRELGYEVLNYAKMGATVTRGMEIMDRTLPENLDGATVILEFGGNDSDHSWREISANPQGEHMANTPLPVFADIYAKMIERVRLAGGRPVLATLVPVDAEKYMRWISRAGSRENILSWLGDTSMLSRWQESYNTAVERLAVLTGTPILDLRRDFLLSHEYKSLMSYDGIHPTDRGHDLIEEKICEMLRRESVPETVYGDVYIALPGAVRAKE